MWWPFNRLISKKNATPTSGECDNISGPRGEKIACRFLRRAGFRILARNYRCPTGEADIIAVDAVADAIVFVEVKTRKSNAAVEPYSAVNADKKRRMKKIAAYYAQKHPVEDYTIRFDIISIVLPSDGQPKIEHIYDAF
ncbi:MAG TPA: YraN family protein [Phycisphaerae bacterium]|nr:YraN family protein [Phycisphaerae bacterium]HPS52964.1 YraN family protein [Phycisphaerae bacterium]